MTVTLWNPTFEVEQLNRMFNDVFGGEPFTSGWRPAVDIYEDANKDVVIKAELPGLKRDSINVTFERDTLTIEGQRPQPEGIGGDHYHRQERLYGSFRRSFTLPATVDSSRVQAGYQDGILTITLPQREEAKPRQIQVNG